MNLFRSSLLMLALSFLTACSAQAKTTLDVTERVVHETTLDIAPEGISVGDVFAWRNDLWNADNTAKVGETSGDCILVDLPSVHQCTITFKFQEGDLVAGGASTRPEGDVFSLFGGTGVYVGVEGQVTLTRRDQLPYWIFEFTQ